MTESFEDLQRIRRSLLDAAAADYRQTLAAVPADVPPSRAYRRWRRCCGTPKVSSGSRPGPLGPGPCGAWPARCWPCL